MLKIQDGCVNFCSYCIIPYTRGRLRSLPLEDAARETERIAAEGYRELVLTGIEVASYGLDLPGKPGLADVIEAVAAAAGGYEDTAGFSGTHCYNRGTSAAAWRPRGSSAAISTSLSSPAATEH